MKTITNTRVKTIDIQAKEWFDKINGNSYFSGIVTVNYGMEDEKTFKMPFQYGYERAYEQAAKYLLLKEGIINTTSGYELREQGIKVNASIKLKCLQRDVKNFGI